MSLAQYGRGLLWALGVLVVLCVLLAGLNNSIEVRRWPGWPDRIACALAMKSTLSQLPEDVCEYVEATEGRARERCLEMVDVEFPEGVDRRRVVDWSSSADESVRAVSLKRELRVWVEGDLAWTVTTVGTKDYPGGKVAVSADGRLVAVVVDGNRVIVLAGDDGAVLADVESAGSDAVSILRWSESESGLYVGRRTLGGHETIIEYWRIGGDP